MKDDKKMSFEDAIRRLEAIAAELEKEGSDLDASLKLYEEGVSLIRFCNEQLENAERKVKVLSMSSDGEILQTDFDMSRADGEVKA